MNYVAITKVSPASWVRLQILSTWTWNNYYLLAIHFFFWVGIERVARSTVSQSLNHYTNRPITYLDEEFV